ncbi:MAG: MBL fold metallo-hydrolase [Luteolibacter sp.]|uniref:MBL fold metallo-hydrolase n=1 Tax=Luteolibacter sp. TaxID=1962973 RepID=UPI003264787C
MSLFRNPWPHDEHGFLDILRWKLKWGPQETPELPDAPDSPAERRVVASAEIATPPQVGWRVTWIGHASFLLQGGGRSLLIDPVFSEFCAPLPLPGLRRMVATPFAISELPKIDAILLTHGHYDHLDLPTLREIGRHTPIVIAEGHAAWLTGNGFSDVTELAWNERREIFSGINLTSTPAQHFTARTPWDRNHGHWCGWLLEGLGCKLWHAGDSGYCPAFSEIGERHGPIDFGMIPIGAYLPRRIMRAMHMKPEEAVRAFLESQCRRAVAMHWGTFRLTDEPAGEPPILLSRALREHGVPAGCFEVAAVGTQWEILAES